MFIYYYVWYYIRVVKKRKQLMRRFQVKKSLPTNVNIMEEDLEEYLKKYESNIHKIEFGHIQVKRTQQIHNDGGWNLGGYETWTKQECIDFSKNYNTCHWGYHSHFRLMLEESDIDSTP